MKFELAQFREVAAFAQFGSDLDAATQAKLNRGTRLTEMLKQDQFTPMTMEEQVCAVFAGVRGYLDKIDSKNVVAYEAEFKSYLKANGADILAGIKETKALSEANETKLASLYDDFTTMYNSK